MLRFNLILINVMAHVGLKVVFNSTFCDILHSNRCVAQGPLRATNYYLNTANRSNSTSDLALVANLAWLYERLGHFHTHAIQNVCRHCVIDGLKIGSVNHQFKCVSCIGGESSPEPISKCNESRSKRSLELVHSDVCPQLLESMGGSKYITFSMNYYTR